MESFRYTQACAGVPEEVFQMSYPEVDFLYLNEEDMVAAGVKDMEKRHVIDHKVKQERMQ